jgi:hypothetical protein
MDEREGRAGRRRIPPAPGDITPAGDGFFGGGENENDAAEPKPAGINAGPAMPGTRPDATFSRDATVAERVREGRPRRRPATFL